MTIEKSKNDKKGRWQSYRGDDAAWSEMLNSFPDTSYLNSASWGIHLTTMGWKCYRLEFSKSGQAKAYCQSFLKTYPGRLGVLWIPDGIIGEYRYIDNLHQDICSNLQLRFCYIKFRSYHGYDVDEYIQLLINDWSRPTYQMATSLTMILDINMPIETIKGKLTRNWRRCLEKSVKSPLKIVKVEDPRSIAKFYLDLRKAKSLKSSDVFSLEMIISIMEAFKDSILVLGTQNLDGKLLAIRGAIWQNTMATDIFAATNLAGRDLSASHGLLISLIEGCRKHGCVSYDLNGIDPANSMGVYNFKKGTGAIAKVSLGEFEWANRRILKWVINFMTKYRYLIRRISSRWLL